MAKGAHVVVWPIRRNDAPEKMIRRFIKKVKKMGIIEQAKKRKSYEKPSDRKRREKASQKRADERAKQKAKARKVTNYKSKRQNLRSL
jgi:small subunit ribosomal protein S21